MRTNIEIDEQLVREAMQRSGTKTKRAAVEAGLQLLLRTHAQAGMRKLRGKVAWEGDLNASRSGRESE